MRGPTCIACGYERPARSGIVSVDGALHEFDASRFTLPARDGLRAACLANPRSVWDAALIWCGERRPHDDTAARRWAYGVWRGIYPGQKLPRGWYDAAAPAIWDRGAYDLIGREVARFRKQRRAA